MTEQQKQAIQDIQVKESLLRQTILCWCPAGSRREEALASLANTLDHAIRAVKGEPFNPIPEVKSENLDLFQNDEMEGK